MRQIHAPRLPRRRQPKNDPGCDRNRQREQHHRPVNRQVVEPRQALRNQPQQKSFHAEQNHQPRHSPQQRKQQALSQQLPHQPFACRSQRLTHRHLPRSRAGPCQQQIRHIHAADQQHQRHRAQQQDQRLPNVAYHVFLQRYQSHRPPAVGWIIVRKLLPQRSHPRVQLALRRCHRDPRLQAPDRFQGRPQTAVRGRSRIRRKTRRRPHFGVPLAHGSPRVAKTRRHHPDDPVQIVVPAQTSSHYVRIAPVSPLPQPVTDHRLQREPRSLILRIERVPQLRLHTQHRKIRRRHPLILSPRWLRCTRQVHRPENLQHSILKNSRTLQIFKLRNRDTRVRNARARQIVLDPHQFLRVRKPQRMQQRRIHQAENRRCRPDPQRHRQNRNRRKARRLRQHAQRVAQILNQVFKERQPLLRVVILSHCPHPSELQHRLPPRLHG